MAKLSKETIIAELTKQGLQFNPDAEYSDLLKLLKDNPAQKEEIPQPPTPKENIAKARKDLVEAVTKQQSARHGVNIKPNLSDLHPQQALEKRIRGFVARSGGFRAGISPEQTEEAKILLVRAGRDPENPQWDMNIALPGYKTL
jgi:hypothetical protein